MELRTSLLFLVKSLLLNSIAFVLYMEIVNPHFNVMFYNLCKDFCNKASNSAIITQPNAKRRVFISLFLIICIHFIFFVFHSSSISFL
jgi:hypothetical protein